MNVSISLPLDTILKSLSTLSLANRRWLGEHLIEEVEDEASKSVDKSRKESDEEFMERFFALPHDNPMSAKEKEKMIRESHYFDPDRDINHLKYE